MNPATAKWQLSVPHCLESLSRLRCHGEPGKTNKNFAESTYSFLFAWNNCGCALQDFVTHRYQFGPYMFYKIIAFNCGSRLLEMKLGLVGVLLCFIFMLSRLDPDKLAYSCK